MKKRIIFITLIFLFAVIFVTVLSYISKYQTNHPNSFIRRLPPFKIEAGSVKDITFKSMYFVGADSMTFYLANRKIKNHLVLFDRKTLKYNSVFLKLNSKVKVTSSAQILVSPPFVYLLNGQTGDVFRGSTTDFVLTKRITTIPFSALLPISNSSFLLRTVNLKNENTFAKVLEGRDFQMNDSILKKQVDGLFCTDGIFINSLANRGALYIYYYRNQFINIDSSLKTSYYARTIDTTTHAQINISQIKSNKEITLGSPPLLVNKLAAVNQKYLFIQSALRADNESKEIHDNATAIDVYELREGKYQFSFYLPNFAGQRLSDFEVYDKTLMALFGTHVYIFKLNF